MTETMYLIHYGIDGQKWGDKNGPPYPLSREQYSAAEKRLNRKDMRYVKRNEKKAQRQAYRASKKELRDYDKNVLRKKYKTTTTRGKLDANYVNAYNKKMAELMNKNVADFEAPSGRVIQFVAKRREVGVYTALADRGYDMNQLKNGVYGSGKIAYKQKNVEVTYG